MSFWKAALKYHAPATISGFVFFYLVSTLLDNDTFMHENPILSIAVLVVIANFCAYLLYRSTVLQNVVPINKVNIQHNVICDNEVGGHLELSTSRSESQDISIEGNKIKRNKVEGNLSIGDQKRNG